MTAHQELSGQLGRYIIVRKLGAGGMGAVYLAEDTQLGRKVALKVPHFTADEGSAAVERFRREGRLAASIEHPHLCPVHDVGESGGILFFTMPYIEGSPLSRLIEEGKPWPPLRAVELVRKIAGAVAHLHQNGIVHRDLKPGNIIVRASGEPVLMDFGLARSFTSQSQRLTSPGAALGSPAYMSPEQVAGDSDIGPAADIYGLGMILYELLTARLPFAGPLQVLFAQILNTSPAPPSSLCPGIDAWLNALCVKALSKKPEDRQDSVQAFAAELDSCLRQQGHPSGTPVPTMPPAAHHGAVTQTMDLFPQTLPPVGLGTTEAERGAAYGRGPRVPHWNRTWLFAGVFAFLAAGAAAWIVIGGGKPSDDQPKDQPKPKDPSRAGAGREFENSLRVKMVLIPRGKFQMGAPAGEEGPLADARFAYNNERPQHEVTLTRDFYMAATEVTFGQFRQFVKEKDYKTEGERGKPGFFFGLELLRGIHVSGSLFSWKHTGWEQTDEHPVVNVAWEDALKFCEWLSGKENKTYDLPTEAEWEYACRAGSTAAYCFGKDEAELAEYAWFDDNAGKRGAQPVGKKKPNAWGLHDMHGNVWEWCLDGTRAYRKAAVEDPLGDPKKERVRRGGSWGDFARHCRSASRYIDARGNRPYTGFRVVMRPAEKAP